MTHATLATLSPPAKTASRTPADQALSIIQSAFEQDPPVRWLYPSDADYQRYFPDFAAALGAPAFTEGTLALNAAAAALWVQPGSEPDEAALGALIERSIPAHRQADVFAVIEEMGAHHPEEPHWYLPVLGTHPEMQGRGHGAALLRPVLEVCDRTGVSAYLEATTERNRALYARHGFEATAEIRVADCPPLTAMVRSPR
ncbi:GNAT family N-acetyltransferase [Pseudooceanicola atlanticus]|uniref:N-acetyltransferase domain-containing protein n=1 Tax=Pseudooceanicola atlanticus TaxID=1461694 RepID=A0A0A0EJB3_9RHOB|nr:GNAT family N-acetyltransferase [Pseudooceanicola atlanticus]KGM49257.1 hypothetical protein ATO9_04260 [Pseudooceanicola atlanticus]